MVTEADHCGAYFADHATYIERVLTFFATHLPVPNQEFQEARQEKEAAAQSDSDTSTQAARTRRGELLC